MKFRRYLKRAANLEVRSLPSQGRIKRRSITEQPTSVDKSASLDQSDERVRVSLTDEVD
jgi:hypothetical protein